MILNWLVEHIRHTDKKIGEYAKNLINIYKYMAVLKGQPFLFSK